MPYKRSDAQRRYLRRMYADEKNMDRCCDCPGCDKCSGFVTNCRCDTKPLNLKDRSGRKECEG